MSISLEIQGTIHVISKEQQVSEKFRKRDFVLHVANETNPQYDDFIQLQMSQDKCNKLDEVEVGYEVKVFVNIRGKEYSKKDGSGMGYFNTLEAWKIDVQKSVPVGSGETGLIRKEDAPEPPPSQNGEGDDLPF
jgi:hypothetical protein